MYNAKNGRVRISTGDMDYIRFGRGSRVLVMLPGVGDGLKTVKGMLGNLGKPKSFDRFRIQAGSCITHNAYNELGKISCPTLVLGGTDDRIVTGQASEEMIPKIPGATLYMYDGLGHGLYEEAPDFLTRVAEFCR